MDRSGASPDVTRSPRAAGVTIARVAIALVAADSVAAAWSDADWAAAAWPAAARSAAAWPAAWPAAARVAILVPVLLMPPAPARVRQGMPDSARPDLDAGDTDPWHCRTRRSFP
ncbi:hypothetical protein Kisp02_23840 [Kineosporia sp. NBRC 101731]|nr:hypothetical protein Kisp02_23840 [Kineosporia sp. NBRC 101731]